MIDKTVHPFVFSYYGNATHVVTPVFKSHAVDYVVLHDLDSRELVHERFDYVQECVKYKTYRNVELADFEFDVVQNSRYVDQACEIAEELGFYE